MEMRGRQELYDDR